jgi:hypothetical protein
MLSKSQTSTIRDSRLSKSSTSITLYKSWSKFATPIRDHPLNPHHPLMVAVCNCDPLHFAVCNCDPLHYAVCNCDPNYPIDGRSLQLRSNTIRSLQLRNKCRSQRLLKYVIEVTDFDNPRQ